MGSSWANRDRSEHEERGMGEGGWGDKEGGDGFKGNVRCSVHCTVQYCPMIVIIVITPYIPTTHALLYAFLWEGVLMAGKSWGQG